MDKLLKIALMLTAVDNMSNVVNSATNNAMSAMQKLKDYSVKEFANGFMMFEAGKAGFAAMKPAVEAFGDMEEAGIRLQNSLMRDGGVFDGKMYDKLYKHAQKLSDGYTGSTEDYLKMMEVLKNNRVEPEDILGGVGEATAKLGHLFKMQPAAIGEFAAHMRNDMGVATKDMYEVMDLTQRIHSLGVGKDGQEAVYEMNQFFSKVGLGLANLKIQGLEASKAMGVLGSVFMAKGLSGENVGTNFRRILDGLRDPTKIAKSMEVAQKYGLKGFSLHVDEGDPHGIEKFIAKLNTLKGLSTEAVAEILKPFSGRQGLSTDFLELLAHSGVEDYNKYASKAFHQATLTQKEANLSTSYNQNLAIFKSSWRNTIAEMGAVIVPFLTKMFIFLNKATIGLRNFVHNHPGVVKLVAGFIALASSALMIAGAFKIAKVAMTIIDTLMGITKALKWLRIAWTLISPAVWAAMRSMIAFVGRAILMGGAGLAGVISSLWGVVTATWAWTVALLANPITWIVLAVIALGVGVYALIKHWDKVVPFFKKMWENIKGFFASAFNWMRTSFLRFSPVFLIYNHWSQITTFFHSLWDKIKAIFMAAVNWLLSIGPNMFNAGKNIVLQIWSGIKALAHKPVEAIKEMAGKIRNLLPFSPAKDGPLKDIHRIRLVETIAESIKPNALLERMRNVASQVFELRPQQGHYQPLALLGGGGGATIHLQYAPVYHAAPGETTGDNSAIAKFFEQNRRQLMRMIMDELNSTRKSYG